MGKYCFWYRSDKKKINTDKVFGLTSPLITTTNGEKNGKKQSGALYGLPKKNYLLTNIGNFGEIHPIMMLANF